MDEIKIVTGGDSRTTHIYVNDVELKDVLNAVFLVKGGHREYPSVLLTVTEGVKNKINLEGLDLNNDFIDVNIVK